ncbi:MAG: PKD domain-containing protein [Ilumatobacteraceae bacterium]
MRSRSDLRLVARLAAIALGAATITTVVSLVDHSASPADAAADQVMALYNMNEPAGSTVLVDSGPNGLNGSSGPNNVKGVTFDGATAHRYLNREPAKPPAEPERLDTVPENDLLDPGNADFAFSVRYRTTKPFGNIVQKGQNTTIGGYFKLELPFGEPHCLFIGEDAQGNRYPAGVDATGHSINDNQWHTVTCARFQTYVAVFIDGDEVARVAKPTYTINNNKNLSIAGKSSCDQVEVTCDYFVGDIDWVKIERGSITPSNKAPKAEFTRPCTDNVCTLDASASSDSDGTIVSYAWDFGDGTTGTGQIATHAYAEAGSYTVKLTVTDDKGATASITHHAHPDDPPATTTSSTTTTTTTIVDQLPPGELVDIGASGKVTEPAERLNNAALDTTTSTSVPD